MECTSDCVWWHKQIPPSEWHSAYKRDERSKNIQKKKSSIQFYLRINRHTRNRSTTKPTKVHTITHTLRPLHLGRFVLFSFSFGCPFSRREEAARGVYHTPARVPIREMRSSSTRKRKPLISERSTYSARTHTHTPGTGGIPSGTGSIRLNG